MMEINLTVNGERLTWAIRPDASLLACLRQNGFIEVKSGCAEGDCGACLVLLDGKPVNSCMVFAASAQGSSVTTVRGIGTQRSPHVIQESLAESGGVQCGFCTPGMVVAAFALLRDNPDPAESEIRRALDGCLCRCTGYEKIVDGIRLAAARIREIESAAGEQSDE